MKKIREVINEYFKDFDLPYCKSYIIEHCFEEYKSLKKSVDSKMDGFYTFDRNWDMEPTHQAIYINEIEWGKQYSEDEEWTFMFNRQEYLEAFFMVYIIEEDEKYLLRLKEYIFHWIETVSLSKGALHSRTLDTGIRCFSWLEIMMLLVSLNKMSDEELTIIVDSLNTQFYYLQENYIEKYSLSNWGILQTTTMLACKIIFQDLIKVSEDDLRKEIASQIELQIGNDGVHWEQSILYHVQVFQGIARLSIIDKENQQFYQDILYKMAKYIKIMTGPDGRHFATSDSDRNDTRDVMVYAAILLEQEEFLSKAFDYVDLHSIFQFGKKGITIFQSISKQKEENQLTHFEDIGQVVVKHNDSYFYFKNGPMSSGHSHNDETSVCLYHKGKPIWIDPGRYTYQEVEERYTLKSALSHSCCIIDNQPSEIVKDSWDFQAYPQPLYTYSKQREDVYYMEGAYQASTSEQGMYINKRKIVMIQDKLWVIIDDIHCKGKHNVCCQYILDENITFKNNQLDELKVFSDSPFVVEDIQVSPRYNKLIDSTKICKYIEFEDRYVGYTIVCDKSLDIIKKQAYQVGSNKELANSFAFECTGEENMYVVILQDEIHTGSKLVKVDNFKFKSKCVVLNKDTNKVINMKR